MNIDTLIQLTAILAMGVGAQWFSWRIHQPSISLLLFLGFIAGPILGWLDPDAVFGKSLFSFVSLAVAIILFEGGMSLRLRELRKNIANIILRLLTFAILITWALTAIASYYILELPPGLSVLLGAILTVTGPTVIIPLLRSFEMDVRLRSILKWEGIVVDPIGAFLSVLAFEVILVGEIEGGDIAGIAIPAVLKTLIAGIGIGFFFAAFLVLFMRKDWIPDFLHNPVVLVSVLSAFTLSNLLQHESGLLAVTVMGFVLANQKYYIMRHVIEFKENLQVLLIAALFILLSARIRMETILDLSWNSLIFLAILILFVRPAAVFISTIGSEISWKTRAFIAWMAPRGIVAAAVSSVFSLELVAAGHEKARMIVPIVFLVIVGTVLVYGISARPLANLIGVALPDPQGILMVGGHLWARSLARVLKERGIRVLIVDTNPRNVTIARVNDLEAVHGNILDEYIQNELDLSGIGNLVALTMNDEINSLAAIKFGNIYGRSHVFQLAPAVETRPLKVSSSKDVVPKDMRGRCLSRKDATFMKFDSMIRNGAEFRATKLTKEFDYRNYTEYYGTESIPLFLLNESGELFVFSEDRKQSPHAGQFIVGLVRDPGANKQ